MRLLLDTHIALWAITDDPKLSPEARRLITTPGNEIWISIASLWEIAIKHALKKNSMPISAAQARKFFEEAGYDLLPVQAEHTEAVEQLPPLHGDPFDRMLVAQALSEPLRLMTHDSTVGRYSGSIIVV